MRRRLAVGLSIAIVAGAVAAPARGAVLAIEERDEVRGQLYHYHDLRYTAGAGEANAVTVSHVLRDGSVSVLWTDLGAPISIVGPGLLGGTSQWACSAVKQSGTVLGSPTALGAAACTYVREADPVDDVTRMVVCTFQPWACDTNEITVGGFSKVLVFTRDGDDTVSSVDFEQEYIDCGSGEDVVIPDGQDVVSSTCETVLRF